MPSTRKQFLFFVECGIVLFIISPALGTPLQGRFTPHQEMYLRRATSPLDWHPTQLAYQDGVVSSSATAIVEASDMKSTTVSPIDFGGDPLGKKDSSDAFRKAIEALARLCKPDAPIISDTRRLQSPGNTRKNCGGAVLDLRGGWYSVSEPVRVPAGMGNLWIRGGTIFASEDFSPSNGSVESFVLIFGHNCMDDWQENGLCTSNIGVQQLTLDAKKRAGGCLYLDHTSFATVGPGIMVLGFSTFGITAFGSDGTIIQGVFAGEFPNHDKRAHDAEQLHGTAIHFSHPQHDGYITNSIIWSAKVGLVSHGTAQHIIGVHPWNFVTDPNDGHQTSDLNGIGLGMVVFNGKARIEDCYLDTVPLVLNITGSGPMLVSGNVFMKNSSVILTAPPWQQTVRELVVTNNLFSCSNNDKIGSCMRGAVLLDAKFTSIQDTRVEGNVVDHDAGYLSTRARRKVWVERQKAVTIDFAKDLLFDSASLVNGSVSCSLVDGKPMAYSIHHTKAPLRIRVRFRRKWTGRLECTVDQSATTRCAL